MSSKTRKGFFARKKFALIPAFVLSLIMLYIWPGCGNKSIEDRWTYADNIVKRITFPVFPDTNFNILSYGAKAGGTSDCLPAVQKAINECNMSGGGNVIVPKGKYFVKGPLHLKSNVNLIIRKGAILKFSPDPDDYLPAVLTRWEGTEVYNYSPFIYSYDVNNVAITGTGIIDGNAKDSFATWKTKQTKDQLLLRKMGTDGIPVYRRVFGKGHWLRPVMIQFLGCKNVLIDSITVKDSPFWVIHPALCYNVTVKNVTVDSKNLNNDGCDPDASVNVLIENCTFNTGDDAIAIKAGRDQDAWNIGQPTENVVIRNCVMNSKANGLAIGSEMSGGVKNIYVKDCIMHTVKSGLDFKTNLDRGGYIENVNIINVKIDIAKIWGIAFDTDYHGYRGNHFPARFRDFFIENVKCGRAGKYGIFANGIRASKLENITLKDIDISNAEKSSYIVNTENFTMQNVMVNGQKMPKHPLE